MICPSCQSQEFSDLGVCKTCGFNAATSPPSFRPKRKGNLSAMIEMDYCARTESGEPELPQWRQELAKRLQEIKQRRPAEGVGVLGKSRTDYLPFPDLEEKQPPETKVQQGPVATARRRSPRSVEAAVATEKTSRPSKIQPRPRLVRKRENEMPLLKLSEVVPQAPSEPAQISTEPASIVTGSNPTEIQNFIDNILAKQMAVQVVPASESPVPTASAADLQEDRLILLSRTLAALVDLIIISLCASGFILAADTFSGFAVFDTMSLIDFVGVILATYFLYSIFFLGTANQTIGMMTTDLRLVGPGEARPQMGQILMRTAMYLLVLLTFGIGLLVGCFDRAAQCLQDRWSHTRIVRL